MIFINYDKVATPNPCQTPPLCFCKGASIRQRAHLLATNLEGKNMRTSMLLAALLACSAVQAQDSNNSFENVYVGLGATSILSVGYAKPINNSWGMRGEFAITPKLTFNDTVSSGSASVSVKSSRVGLFADWFPFDNQLRLVGAKSLEVLYKSLS